METRQLPGLSRYRICENGAIQRVTNNRYMTWEITSIGYARVWLTFDDGTKKHMYVHRLVAQAFLDNPQNLNEVNHKDENKLNNHYSNLEWCTRQYNNTYGIKSPQNRKKITPSNAKPIVLCDINTQNPIYFFKSSVEIEKRMSINASSVRKACKNSPKGGKAYEYWWRYATSEEITQHHLKDY